MTTSTTANTATNATVITTNGVIINGVEYAKNSKEYEFAKALLPFTNGGTALKFEPATSKDVRFAGKEGEPVFDNAQQSVIMRTEYVDPDFLPVYRGLSERDFIKIVRSAKQRALNVLPANATKSDLVIKIEELLEYEDGQRFGGFYYCKLIQPDTTESENGFIINGYKITDKKQPIHQKFIRYYLKEIERLESAAKRAKMTFEDELAFVSNEPLSVYALKARR